MNELDNAFTLQTLHLAHSRSIPMTGALETHAFCLLVAEAGLIDYEFALDRDLRSLYNEYQAEVRNTISCCIPALI